MNETVYVNVLTAYIEKVNYREKQKQNPRPRKVKCVIQGHTAN